MNTFDPHDQPEAGAVRIFLCGDVMIGRGIDQALPHPGAPELREDYVRSATTYVRLAEEASGPLGAPIAFADIWGEAREIWRREAPAVRLANLETAVTTSGDFAAKGVNYRMNPQNMPALVAAGLQACALANNHVLDFGLDGLDETLGVLRGHGIAVAGAGRNLAEAQAPAILPAGPARVLFCATAAGDCGVPHGWAAGPRSPGVDLIALTQTNARAICERLARVRRPGDVAVVSIHWGSNWGYQVPDDHRRFAHALIDSGQVAVVHGHSSHHPRPIEVYRDRLILYGCGDFLNDYEGIRGYEEFRSQLVAMYFADVDPGSGTLRRLRLAPLEIRRFRLTAPEPAQVAWFASTLSHGSRPFGVELAVTEPGVIEASWGNGSAPHLDPAQSAPPPRA